jgi:large subunit ribosomal protein L18
MAIQGKKGQKVTGRVRNKIKIRKKISGSDARPRISVFKSSLHTYAQVISDVTAKTIVSASTLEKEVIEEIAKLNTEGSDRTAKSTKSVIAARAVGVVLARRSKAQKIERVVFDRNGFVFHGRIKAVADGAREGGLEF